MIPSSTSSARAILTTSTNSTNAADQPSGDLEQLDLDTLARYCIAQSELFYDGQSSNPHFAYELFRRALVKHDERAWEYIYTHYTALVESWVRRSGAFISTGESSEFFVGAAFTKFWRAINSRFEHFPTLASLLHYLQLCASSVVIDSVRTQSWAEMLPEETLIGKLQHSPDEEAMQRVTCEEFWHYINTQLQSEAERVVVFRSFVLGMKPGDIYTQHQDLFQNINDVYNVKRNVLGRLSRNPELRQMLGS